jgi:hypothetical protein
MHIARTGRSPARQKPPLGSEMDWGHPLESSLAAYWLCHEGAGRRVRDVTGKGRDGLLTGSAVSWGCGPGGSMGLRAVPTASTTEGMAVPPITTGTTFTLLVRLLISSYAETYGSVIVGPSSSIGLWARGGGVSKLTYFYIGDHLTNSVLALDRWYDAILSVRAGAGTWYLDGRPDGTMANVLSTNLTYVGNDNSSNSLHGSIAHLALWTGRALTADEARQVSAEPYALIRPAGPQRRYFTVSGLGMGFRTTELPPRFRMTELGPKFRLTEVSR